MNRNDYMDLLRDYLRSYFSAEETEDMIRDYEEFFEMGIASGKTEAEVITSLGSPKKVSQDLADELLSTKAKNNGNAQSSSIQVQAFFKRGKRKLKHFFEAVSDKATNLLKIKEDNIFKKVLRFFVRTIGFIAKATLYLFIAIASLFFIGFGLLSIFVFGTGIAFFTVDVPLAFAIIFFSFILIGLFLIGFEVLRALFMKLRLLSKKLATWWRYRIKGVTSNE